MTQLGQPMAGQAGTPGAAELLPPHKNGHTWHEALPIGRWSGGHLPPHPGVNPACATVNYSRLSYGHRHRHRAAKPGVSGPPLEAQKQRGQNSAATRNIPAQALGAIGAVTWLLANIPLEVSSTCQTIVCQPTERGHFVTVVNL